MFENQDMCNTQEQVQLVGNSNQLRASSETVGMKHTEAAAFDPSQIWIPRNEFVNLNAAQEVSGQIFSLPKVSGLPHFSISTPDLPEQSHEKALGESSAVTALPDKQPFSPDKEKADNEFNEHASELIKAIFKGDMSKEILQNTVNSVAKDESGAQRLATYINEQTADLDLNVNAEVIPALNLLRVTQKTNDGEKQVVTFYCAELPFMRNL